MEIAEASELIRCPVGQEIHCPDTPITSVYLIVHGRLRIEIVDAQGRILMQRHQKSGSQFGGIAAAVAEPTPTRCIAEDPSIVLKIDYQKCLDLTKKHDVFRANFSKMIANSIKSVVFSDRLPTLPKVVSFFHQGEETRDVSHNLFTRLTHIGESIGVFTDRPPKSHIQGAEQFQTLGSDQDWTIEQARTQAAKWLAKGRVLVDYSTNVDSHFVCATLEASHLVLWCVTSDNWKASIEPLKNFLGHAPGWSDKLFVLWLLKPDEEAPLAREIRKLTPNEIKISLDPPAKNRSSLLRNGCDRLLHLVRGVKIGVALGGGAARGMAHIGVLKALERNGIAVDMIAGTSAGAMTGTLYSAGFCPDYLTNRFVNDLRPPWCFRWLPRGDQWHLLYKYRMGRFDPMLRKYLKEIQLEQMMVPMNIITVDLIGGQPVIRNTGDAVHGITESINLPVLSKPINRSGQALVDGGLINNVPADVLIANGCNFVIAVSVTSKLEYEFVGNRPDTPAHKMRSASTIQTLLRSFLVQSTSINAIGVQSADFIIEPDVRGFDLTEFTRTDELAAIGEQTTKDSIAEIRRLLNRLDANLFPASDS